MMISFIVFIVALSIFEVRSMLKKNLKRELVIFHIIALITLSYGILYFSNPFKDSFAKTILDIINPNYSK